MHVLYWLETVLGLSRTFVAVIMFGSCCLLPKGHGCVRVLLVGSGLGALSMVAWTVADFFAENMEYATQRRAMLIIPSMRIMGHFIFAAGIVWGSLALRVWKKNRELESAALGVMQED